MPRPPLERRLGSAIVARRFGPAGDAPAGAGSTEPRAADRDTEQPDSADRGAVEPAAGELVLSLDEVEALRLADLEGLYQQAAALRMGVSRQTFGRIIESARRKTSDAILNGKSLRIEGGSVTIDGGGAKPALIAVPTTATGGVEEHFGHCDRFTLFALGSDGRLLSERLFMVAADGGCRPGLIAALAAEGVTHFLVGRMGEGAMHVAAAHGIVIRYGAGGPVRAALDAFLRGELSEGGECCDGRVQGGRNRGCGRGGGSCPGRGVSA
ncbi:MAG TPA: DUF134 domain-containing protein [Rectinemataceae bacterium]|nr:DUF134 domain-containing protein [Rectinemataceae bacterium]